MDRAQTLDEDEFRQRYGLNRTSGGGSGSQSAEKRNAKASDADDQAPEGEKAKNALSGLIQGAANRLKSTIAALAGRASLSGGTAGSLDRVSNVKVKQL